MASSQPRQMFDVTEISISYYICLSGAAARADAVPGHQQGVHRGLVKIMARYVEQRTDSPELLSGGGVLRSSPPSVLKVVVLLFNISRLFSHFCVLAAVVPNPLRWWGVRVSGGKHCEVN